MPPDCIQNNADLSALNTLGVASVAEYFAATESLEALIEAVRWAKAQGLSVSILGGGSNVLLAPKVTGLVIQPKLLGKTLLGEAQKKGQKHEAQVLATFGAGEPWHQAVCWALDHELFGLENLALIPGSVGAAPVQNIGAYGVELAEVFTQLTALNLDTLEVETKTRADCGFAYRDSIFKSGHGRWVILTVTLNLSREYRPVLSYPALNNYLTAQGISQPSARQVFDAVCAIRTAKIPTPEVIPNCGSFFKNPVVARTHYERLKQQYPGLVAYDEPGGGKKLAAGWLIDQAGWKGRGLEGVSTHVNQALVIVNPQRKAISSVLALAQAIQAQVEALFGVNLELEPRALGFELA